MGQTATSNLRTVALVGHGAAGKTTLAESLLAAAGAISSRGTVEKGSTVCDFDAQEKEFGYSLNSALASFSWQGILVHLLDTPGFPDFAGQAIAALAAVDTALVVINAQNGIELSSERMMKLAAARGVCRMIVINKIDAENVNLPALVGEIRDRFGRECMLLDLPVKQGSEVVELLGHDDGESDFESVAAAHRALIDQIVEEDEDLLARYLDEGIDPTPDELHRPFEKALRAGHLIPILFVSAKTGAGIPQLLDVLARLAPNPAEGNPPPFYRGEIGTSAEPWHLGRTLRGRARSAEACTGARLQGRQRPVHRQGRSDPRPSGDDPEGFAALCRRWQASVQGRPHLSPTGKGLCRG